MLFEATTLNAVARVIAETLETDYVTDPQPLFADAGLDYARLADAGSRYPWRNMQKLWQLSEEVTGDAWFRPPGGQTRPAYYISRCRLLVACERNAPRIVESTLPILSCRQHGSDRFVLG